MPSKAPLFGSFLEDLRAGRPTRDAIQAVLSACQEKNERPWALLSRGLHLFAEEQWEQAYLALIPCLGTDALGALAHHVGGLIVGARGTNANFAMAREHFRTAGAVFPDWVENLTYFGQYAYYTGDQDAALEALRHALALAPEDQFADYTYISALGAAGHVDALQAYLASKKTVNPVFETDAGQLHTPQHKAAPFVARYPEQQQMETDWQGVLRQTVLSDLDAVVPFIEKKTRFFTIGSCFATNLAKALEKEGYECANLFVGETINTTYANQCIVQWLNGSLSEDLAARMNEILRHCDREQTLAQIRAADVLIYTLGVAPAFFDRQTGAFILPKATELNAHALARHYRFRATSVDENEENLRAILGGFLAINPKLKVFLSVSPVPLRATFERKAAVVADCLSKSILRVAAEKAISENPGQLFYWPSFEMIRWLGVHKPGFYGADDGCALHVSESLIDQCVGLFLTLFRKSPEPSR